MRQLLISAAVLALLAAPALGQPDRGDDHRAPAQQPHAAPGPRPQGGGARPDNRAQAPRPNGGGHFDRGGPAAPQQAQAPQRQPGAGHFDTRAQPAAQAAQPNRGNAQDRRGPGNGNFNRPGNRPAGANPAFSSIRSACPGAYL